MRDTNIPYQQAAKLTIAELTKKLNSSVEGLLTSEVELRYLQVGKNRVEEQEEKVFTLILRQFQSPFIYLLLVAGFLSLFLGEVVDSLLIFLFVVINAALGFYQEFRSHNAVKSLKRFLIHECIVIRDHKPVIIQSEDVVVGDVIILKAGDKIPADVRFFDIEGLQVDESILTGESIVTDKQIEALTSDALDFYQAKNIGFSGTLVSRGKGKALVTATGTASELGSLSRQVLATDSPSAFEVSIASFSQFILRLSLGTIVLVFILSYFLKGEAFSPAGFTVFSLALIVGVIPEALPLVTTVALSSGALRLARKKVVPKRLSAIEDLGSITVLATDKTGTLTENKLTVEEVKSVKSRETLKLALLASSFFSEFSQKKDPFEVAIWEALTPSEQDEVRSIRRLGDRPFDPVRKFASAVITDTQATWIVTLGAWEELVGSDKDLRRWAEKQGEIGRRVLGVGKKEKKEDAYSEDAVEPVGLISFRDPLKKSAKEALHDAYELGIQVKILTGDGAQVSASVALETGLILSRSDVVEGEKWRGANNEQKKELVRRYHVFARMTPQDKYECIKLLKEEGDTVGFLGEGFNDAPALKLAHVGLAVPSAADIARDASDIILLNRSLEVIIDGIREGRRTFANTFKYIKATLTSNFGNFYALSIASLLVPFPPMLPVQILLVNLLSDFPLISIATDNVEKKELERPQSYEIREIAFFATILGLVSTVIDFGIFGYFLHFGEHTLQTMWFIGSILTELVIFYSIRNRDWFFRAGKPATLIVILTIIIALITVGIPFSEFGQAFLGFTKPRIDHLFIVLIFVLGYFVISEISKIIYYKSFAKQK